MKKGIAIRTILLLFVGVIAVAILVYLIYTSSRTPSFTVAECRSKLIEICNICMNTGWDENFDLSSSQLDTVLECSGYAEFFNWDDNRCCGNSCCLAGTCGGMMGDCAGFELPV